MDPFLIFVVFAAPSLVAAVVGVWASLRCRTAWGAFFEGSVVTLIALLLLLLLLLLVIIVGCLVTSAGGGTATGLGLAFYEGAVIQVVVSPVTAVIVGAIGAIVIRLRRRRGSTRP